MIYTAKQHHDDTLVLVSDWFFNAGLGRICGFQIGSDDSGYGEETGWSVPSQLLGIDITDWLIAAFTGVLVILNWLLVIYNWRLSKATRTSADAAKEAADAATKQAILAEKSLFISQFPDVHVAEFNAHISDRGTWVLATKIKSDRITFVSAIHFMLQGKGSLKEREVRRVRNKISPRMPYVATVRIARIPKDIESLQATVRVYYSSLLDSDTVKNTQSQYWIHRQSDNSVRVMKKDPKDRFKIE